MTWVPSQGKSTAPPRRGLEVVTGSLVLLFALGITALAGGGIYRIGSEAYKYRIRPAISSLAFLLVLILVAIPLWVFTLRLLRGRGHRGSPNLFSPPALRLSAFVFLGWVLFVVWASLSGGDFSYLALALPALLLAVVAFRRAAALRSATQPADGSPPNENPSLQRTRPKAPRR